jgi:hypothetical protein
MSTTNTEPPVPKHVNVIKWILICGLFLGLIYVAKLEYDIEKNPPLLQHMVQNWEDSVKKSMTTIIKQKDDSILSSQNRENVYRDSVIILNEEIQSNNEQINNIKQKNNEKIIYVTALSTDSLAKFFTERFEKK